LCGPSDKERTTKYSVTITKTSDGKQEYMQIISADQFSINIVLIGEFELKDARPKKEKK